ncbi:amino acid adenylation domain-containing protein [Lyngbya sp. CCAP 1446/10]|nr:amino acid adenylation domain-containing protein [Lyngbya sp. CCAP 1446/10]
MLGHFKTLLAGIVANSEQDISTLPVLTEAERHQLLVEWNNTDAEYPRNKCSHQLVEEQVERTPDAVAVEFEEEQLTYQELNRRANQVAHYLRSLGVKPEVPVGFCVERSEARVIGLLGIFKSNGVYVPLDPTYPEERLAYMLSDSSVQVLLTTQKTLQSLPQLALTAQGRQIVYLDREWEVISQQNSENPVTQVKPDNLAYVTYTSGSTGRPKGVVMEHRAFCHYIWWQVHSSTVSSSARTLQFGPLSFDVSLEECFTTWSSGGILVLVSEEVRRNPLALASFVAERSIERLFLPYVALRNLAEVVNNGGLVPTTLREIMVAGEQLQITPAIAYLFKQTGGILYNQYGLSENSTITQFILTGETSSWPALPPIGSAVANAKVYILDRFLQPVPIGVRGELYVGGEWLARGYLNLPELTSERFISNPFGSGRLLRTRDIARYLSDGNIEYLGRADNWVKIRGFSIELGEIETVMAQHPAVKESVVVPREDIPGNKRLVAYVVPHEHAASILNLEAEQERVSLKEQLAKKLELAVRNYLRERLPDYMVPAVFVAIEKMPLTPSGKVNRLALPVPHKSRSELATTLVMPKSEIEKLIAQVWIEVLELDVVGIHDNFFELGGHSLLLTQIHYKLAEMFGMELSTMALVQYPTIHALAQHLNQTDFKQSAVNVGEPNNRLTLKSIAEQQRQHRQGNLPLSLAQQQMWLLSQLDPNNPSYSELEALRLKGFLNVVALEQSINKIIQRHEALRTNFVTVDGQPVQVIATSLTLKMSVVDLTALPSSERENSAQRLATVQAQQPFDLTTDPLIQATLLKLTDTEHILLLKIHHIVWDGWSMGVFVRELAAFYTSFCNDLSFEIPSLPIQYADFAVWQWQWLTPLVLESQLAYWKQQLEGAPALLELPTDRVRPSIQTYRGAHQRFALSVEITEALMSLSQRQKVTLFMTLLAAFKTLLYRYTGQTDIIVGTPHANRDRPEFEGLIGFFANRLVLRTCLSGNPSFEDILSRVRDVALGAYAHQDLPFKKLVEELQPVRDLSYTPLVQVIFNLNVPMPQIQMAGLTVSSLAVETATAKFDLMLFLENTAAGLIGQWEYNTDLFDATTIARMAGHFQTLLEGIVANPQQKVSSLSVLTEQEQHQLLVEWNNTTKEGSFDKCIHELFEEQVTKSPDAIAVVFEEEQLTYFQLNQQANYLAHHLRTLGVGPEVLVGICVERSLDMVVSLLGILKAGGAYLPLDPALPKESLAFRLQDAQVPILLTQKGLLKREEAQVQTVLYLDADWELIAQESDANPKSEVIPKNLAYVLYTSGSTGQPKGVAIEHRQILNYLHTILDKLQLPTGASFATVSTFAADLGNTAIFPALCTGGCLHIVSQELSTDPKALADYFGRHPIDCLKITPAHLATLLASNASNSILPRQCLVLGGEAANWDLIEKIRQEAPNCRILNHYGPTETTVGVLTYPVENKPASYNSKTVPIGCPIANTQVYILDRHQQPVPIGVLGELHIGGASLARGYLNDLDLTTAKFISNPFSDQTGTRLYKTGDLARYLRDGNIEFLGRIDNQVKIRGFRIELGEIEAVLSQHPEVRETVVLARDDQPDNKRLVAYVVPNHKPPATRELRHFLFQKLPDYMVPGAFVMLSSLPLTPNGKIDRRALKAPDTELSDSIGFVPPRDTVEQQLQLLWSEVLQLPAVGVKDNFFELGGHSLLAVLLMARISRHFGKNLPIATLFSSPTIEQLGSCLRLETNSLPPSPLVAIQSGSDKRPFFFVPGVGGNVMYLYELARHLGSSQPFYGLSARGLDGESEPFTQLEEIASYYIEAIQTVQQKGPYLLGGHSFGGVVAFEMAMMLHKQGQDVALLAMIDSVAPIVGQKSKGIDEDDAAYLTEFANYIGYMCSKNLEVSRATLAKLTPVEQLHYLKERLIRVNLLPPDAGIMSVRGLVQVYIASMKAYRIYLPSGMQQTPITLFRANELDVFESDTEELAQRLKEPALGWNDFSATIDIHVVPGNHMTMMQQPHVQVLATQLLSCLEQAQAFSS